jgi:hypothetical protein
MEKSIEELTTAELIIFECEALKNLLLNKNAQYGDAVHQPGLLFNIDPVTAIQARINDKLNRIKNKGLTEDTEDSLQDLLGYIVHLRIALIRKQRSLSK